MRQPMSTLPREEWHRTLAVNLTSVFDGCMTAARHIQQGSIINISSGAGTGPVPGSGHYGAAKAGVNSLTWTLSAELAPSIRVNGVMPGSDSNGGYVDCTGKNLTISSMNCLKNGTFP